MSKRDITGFVLAFYVKMVVARVRSWPVSNPYALGLNRSGLRQGNYFFVVVSEFVKV